MSLSKITLIIISSLILMAGIFLYLNFGNIAKNKAEQIASNALGVKVELSSLSFSLKEKKATIKGIKIANPPGFRNQHIITADRMNIGLKTASRELIDFNDIQVGGTVINLEVTEKGTNLQALKKLASQKKQKESAGSEQVRVIVRKMVINESTINPSVTLLKKDIGSFKLPTVRVSGIGQNSNGAIAQDAVTQIAMVYLKAAEAEVRQQGLSAGVQGLLKEVEGSLDVEGTLDDAAKSLQGLFD